ncbi:phosphoacetylglucosamine mutase-like [Varroa destructor]|uniref:Phosphoacetylglucosamine mutase n=1 Tax=Varroa destructor TaxID=109461 RepID=A0A7M7KPG3_VARDE|nr:phosphoacetylglucosamine mutase-like [Varroa destructor]
MFRLGVIAALRSRSVGGATIGCMVTASHNPECDNGAKLIDPLGEMMEISWEARTTEVVNAADNELLEKLEKIVTELAIPEGYSNVVVGCDTRKSSPGLLQAVIDGAGSVASCMVQDVGTVTTPQLHFIVRCRNDPKYGTASLDGYYGKLSAAFNRVVSTTASNPTHYNPKLTVDAANGVGSEKLRVLAGHLGGSVQVTIVNDGDGILNHECGADYVKTGQKAPAGLTLSPLARYASLDGDADRLVYYFADSEGKFRLLDGDRIATLLTRYLKKLLDEAQVKDLDLAIIQTAYANGSSTEYIRNKLNVSVTCVPTGVKHLHHEALKAGVGIYFEANGHGTICFSARAKQLIASSNAVASRKLLDFIDMTNETVGDALSDLLLVEAVLRDLDLDVADWLSEYEDLPSRQIKVTVPDRTAIKTTNAETKCTAPEGLQAAIDTAVARYPKGRSFVRPSGTEDIVRVYAEAAGETNGKENAELLAAEVVRLVQTFLAEMTSLKHVERLLRAES